MNELSELKKMLLSLDDRDLIKLFASGSKCTPSPQNNSCSNQKWYKNKNICGLPQEGLEHLKELETQSNDPSSAHQVDRKLLRYLRTLKRMKLNIPIGFHEKVDPKSLYKRLNVFCEENDIPTEIAKSTVPSLINYLETGRMRPIIFVGEKGCGKTTAVKMLVEEALKIPTEVIKVPQTGGGHGMTGDCGSYQSADAGYLAKAQLKHNSLLVAFLFDEIDKVTHEHSRANLDDELLSITDESNNEIYDNYLECTLIGLEHCPLFFTANNIKNINPLLADRCTILEFPNANTNRIKSIMKKYVDKELSKNLFHSVNFNFNEMNKTIEELVNHNVRSLRKHQQLIESVLQEALNQVLVQESDTPVQVSDVMFSEAKQKIIMSEGRKEIGFGV